LGRSSPDETAFINLAYVPSNEELYLGLIASLAGFGLAPVAALHDPGSDPQLSRIYRLIEESSISFHDLSYVSLDPPSPRTPRFNMPFELGLAVAIALSANRRHRWFLLDKVAHRAAKSLSDISGVNVQIHDGRAASVLKAVSNALARQSQRPTLEQLTKIYTDVAATAQQLKSDGWSDIFLQSPFRDLRLVAAFSARTHVPGLRRYLSSQSKRGGKKSSKGRTLKTR
jgi:hypothetical protein